VLVSFAGVLLAARGVRKERSVAMQPFGAPGFGPIGAVADGVVEFAADPHPRAALPAPDARFDAVRVDVVAAYPGADDALLRAAAAAGAHGVVIVGTGAGNTTPPMVPAIRDLVGAGVLVALGARAGDGPVAAKYGGGGGADALEAGAIPLGALTVPQGRMLAALLLSQHPAAEAGRRLAELALDAHPAQFPATEGHPS
jgi:L-asparaginase